MSRDELNVLGSQLKIEKFRQLKKEALIEALLNHPDIEKTSKPTWWNLYHNHVYGLIGVLGTAVTIAALVFAYYTHVTPNPNPLNEANHAVVGHNEYGSLKLNLERRNALQNEQLSPWLKKTRDFKDRFLTAAPPTERETKTFILEFVDFAERTFTPLQVKSFEGIEAGIGGPEFEHMNRVDANMRDSYRSLCVIEFWLSTYIDLNRRNEEPQDPINMAV